MIQEPSAQEILKTLMAQSLNVVSDNQCNNKSELDSATTTATTTTDLQNNFITEVNGQQVVIINNKETPDTDISKTLMKLDPSLVILNTSNISDVQTEQDLIIEADPDSNDVSLQNDML